MPKFKPNTSAFKMKGYTYAGTSPLQKDVTMWDANGTGYCISTKVNKYSVSTNFITTLRYLLHH